MDMLVQNAVAFINDRKVWKVMDIIERSFTVRCERRVLTAESMTQSSSPG